ncbi:hypothetical protein CVT24_001864 [Panaeolus cyanescens]|uniref:Peptide hydrolase n=1 Tax=Panaeolus cyanescens TaxID=181874 RepID=A0A409YEM9_9AGAR|nr:hypothetical protein CVT24_001864 [Panaeolus cyanescens]
MKITSSFLVLALAGLTIAEELEERTLPFPLLPFVSSTVYQALVSEKKLLNHAKEFVKFSKLSNGTRVFGSEGHQASIRYIKKLLDDTKYYDTEFQTFNYLYSQGTAAFQANGTNYDTAWFTYGPGGTVVAPIVPVNDLGCTPGDYPAAVAGKIALIKRGTCEFGLKIALAGSAGAAGALLYNNAPGSIGGGTLGAPSRPEGPYVAAGSLTGADGEALRATILAGSEVIGTLKVDAVNEDRTTSNVIATTKRGNKDSIVVVGGHTDSVVAGPGINDDGSGTIGILELALKLPLFNVKNAVRFGFWTAEEFGLVGSEHYVTNLPQEERDKIALYLNFDMIASPNAGYFIYDGDGSAFGLTGPPGSAHIEKTFEDFFAKKKTISAPTEFSGRSDYGPFLDVGIPAGGLFTGAEGVMTEDEAKWWKGKAGVAYDVCYHKDCDGIDNLNLPVWVLNTKAAAHSIATYANSLKGIPFPRVAPETASAVRIASLPYEERRHSACGHEVAKV